MSSSSTRLLVTIKRQERSGTKSADMAMKAGLTLSSPHPTNRFTVSHDAIAVRKYSGAPLSGLSSSRAQHSYKCIVKEEKKSRLWL